jgi:hypothetical protein
VDRPTVDESKGDEAVALLRRLLKVEPLTWRTNGLLCWLECHYCRVKTTDRGEFEHKPDCPYVEAVVLFGGSGEVRPGEA